MLGGPSHRLLKLSPSVKDFENLKQDAIVEILDSRDSKERMEGFRRFGLSDACAKYYDAALDVLHDQVRSWASSLGLVVADPRISKYYPDAIRLGNNNDWWPDGRNKHGDCIGLLLPLFTDARLVQLTDEGTRERYTWDPNHALLLYRRAIASVGISTICMVFEVKREEKS
ncbi:hypothetical protein TOPH_09204 [Tolypocladium ophioglossoides CBS 100239]|uniref:Uncharacterized protein n=1 Tax=Tolypocladium ophioglossoides (strain CBS 100239) TaxID=1163406 RepID=A0A0L0MWL1_TOLOC|nr:hypothetical protein TOPH_09204 [Tolypocladium ophioglossoides CBS 100239]